MSDELNVDIFENEDDFQIFRGEAIEYMKNLEESILKRWLSNIGYNEPIGYYICLSTKTVDIYATRPGVLIGKAGIGVNMLKTMLTNELRGNWTVKFIEIRGGIIDITKDS